MRPTSIPKSVLLITTLLVAGCRSVSEEWHSTSELSDALLTVSDLDGRWQETQRDMFDERGDENPVIDPTSFCPAAAEPAATLTGLAGQSGADVEMQVEGTSRMLRLQAWDNENATRFLSAVSTAADACDGIEWTDESVGVTSTFEVIDGPELGDESVHWIQVASPPADNPDAKFGGAGRTTVARYGSVVMVLQVGDFGLDPESQMMSEVEWLDLVNLAADQIAEL